MDTDYATHYRDLFEQRWWWRAREHVILDALRSFAGDWSSHRARRRLRRWPLFRCASAIDGVTLVEGVEPAVALVSTHGPHRDRIHVAPFDAHFEPGRRYSAVLMLDVIEHLLDQRRRFVVRSVYSSQAASCSPRYQPSWRSGPGMMI